MTSLHSVPRLVVLFGWCILLALVLQADTLAQEVAAPEGPQAVELLRRLKPKHPRLLVDEAGFQRLGERIKTDATLQAWDEAVRREADKLLKAPLPEHVLPDGVRLLSTSRTVLHRSYTLALMYRLHGDRRYADRLWQELDTVAAFPDFNPKHFLDTAEMTHALGIAYDWLFDTWTDAQRATIREAIVRHGLKPGLAAYNKKGWWPRSIYNWNQVCNGGMTVGALAIADEEPALAGAILQHAIASVPLAMASYAPDGAWNEGPGYWAYATTYNVVMLASLTSALGSDFGLSNSQGFDQTGLFPLYMAGPTGRTFNFADSGDRVGWAPCLFWLGARFNQPVSSWCALQGRPSAAGMVYYQTPGHDPKTAKLPLDRYWRVVEVATLRSDWTDPKALFVGVQAGSNRVSHNHLDLGSFVLDALGERWVVDLGADNYNLPGYFGGKRYDYYRMRAEGHNTLVLNPGEGPDQDKKADCRIRQFKSADDWAYAVADLTPAYAAHARRVERGVAMLDRRQVLVQDEVQADKPLALWWFMHTPAAVALEDAGRRAVLELKGKKLAAHILGPDEARFEVRPAEPLPTSPNPDGQRRNTDVRKLTVHLPKVDNVRLTVVFTPLDTAKEVSEISKTPEVKPLATW
jgi:hypothetical protein